MYFNECWNNETWCLVKWGSIVNEFKQLNIVIINPVFVDGMKLTHFKHTSAKNCAVIFCNTN